MLKEAIFHSPISKYLYAYDKKTLHIRLRTKKDDCDAVFLRWGDPFTWKQDTKGIWEWYPNEKLTMEKTASTSLFDYWFISVKPEYKRLKYAFELHDGNEVLVYSERGILSSEQKDDSAAFFTFPYLNAEDVFTPPEWVKDTIWYQIFPERFANGDPSLDVPGTIKWGSKEPEQHSFFGGDLKGIIDHLDDLTELGINGIYLTPIFKAASNHKYDTIDYMEIDPQFGDKATFKALVLLCHQKGIKVMLDAVFNHSGYHFPPFQDVLINGENSKYKDWFFIDSFPLKEDRVPNYATFGFSGSMPKLNTAHPELREYLLETGRYWVREFDIDGWRLDVANEVSHDFWRAFRKEVKAIKPDVYILGEIWHDSTPWLQGDQFDAVMNYPYTSAAIQFFAKNALNPSEFVDQTTEAMLMYQENVAEAAFNLLGSHDTPRILTECKDNKDKVKQLFAFLLSAPGTPCIYYGDEIGLTGIMDPGCRKCMEWDEEKRDQEIYLFVKKLISLRKTHSSFGNKGKLVFENDYLDKKIIFYKKTDGEDVLFFLFNSDDVAQSISLHHKSKNRRLKDLMTETEIDSDSSITLSPNDVKVFQLL